MGLTNEEIAEIRVFLKKAKNPIFFFDDDSDGLAAALTLKKKYNRGVMVPLKVSPHADQIYLSKVEEHRPDAIFILDRPIVVQSVFDQIKVPAVWIDHHEPKECFNVHYYNPTILDKNDNRCTSYWAYQVAKKNMWIAMIGIVGDWQIPDFMPKFPYKKLLNKKKTPPEIMFDSDFGKVIKIFHFNLKGQTSDVKKSIAYLEKIKTPYELLEKKNDEAKFLCSRYEKVNKEYQSLFKSAMESDEPGDPYVFTYPSSKTSFTGELSNELLYRLTDHNIFIIARLKDDQYRISIRGRKYPIRPILNKALLKVEGYGGGHPMACGASVKKDDFSKFLAIFREEAKQASLQE